MRLRVVTPTAVVEEADDVRHLRAEDSTGAFGVLPGHADFVTVLPLSVATWTNGDGAEHFVLVLGGVLSVSGGDLIEIAARGAFREADLGELSASALRDLARSEAAEEVSLTSEAQLHFAAIRQIERVLQAGRGRGGPPPQLGRRSEAGGGGRRDPA